MTTKGISMEKNDLSGIREIQWGTGNPKIR